MKIVSFAPRQGRSPPWRYHGKFLQHALSARILAFKGIAIPTQKQLFRFPDVFKDALAVSK